MVLPSSSANLVPLSDQGWLVVLWVTVALAVLWIVGVVVVSRQRAAHGPGQGVQSKPPTEPGTATKVSARVVILALVVLSFVVLIVFLGGRVGDLLA